MRSERHGEHHGVGHPGIGPPVGHTPTTEGGLRLGSPVEVAAAVPYLLGFHPRDSLVLVTIAGRRIALAARIDLPARREAAAIAGGLAEVIAERGCDELIVLVVGGGARPTGRRPPRADLVGAVRSAFAGLGIPVSAALWVAEVTAGTAWWCYGSGARGALPDPAASAVAAATVAAGHVVYPDREHLERLVGPAAPEVLERRSRLLDAHRRRGGAGESGPVESLALVRAWADRAGDDPIGLADEDVVSLCVALGDPVIRDCAFDFARGPTAAGAERLWTALVRESPEPEVAEPAVLLAHCALARGNGALVGIALDRALRAWPGHRMGELFRSALDRGIGPDDLLGWFAEGAAEARHLLRRRTG